MKEFLSECEALGLKIVTLHTSGHADSSAIERLIEATKPDVIIPVHTENAEWFNKFEPEITVVTEI
jgi:ribonuclease J